MSNRAAVAGNHAYMNALQFAFHVSSIVIYRASGVVLQVLRFSSLVKINYTSYRSVPNTSTYY